MSPAVVEQLVINLEKEIENMELRILESVWSLERAVLDQMEMLKSFRSELRILRSQIELQQLQNLDRTSLAEKIKTITR